jgi:hypothetical protein
MKDIPTASKIVGIRIFWQQWLTSRMRNFWDPSISFRLDLRHFAQVQYIDESIRLTRQYVQRMNGTPLAAGAGSTAEVRRT